MTTPAYDAWNEHLSTCDDCANGTPEPGDEDYVCPAGKKLKALWLDGDGGRLEDAGDPGAPSEFQLACVQMVITFATRCEGDPTRLAAVAKANVVTAEACRSLILRSQILGKRWDAWTQAELLDLVRTADANDVPPGEKV